MKKKITVLEKSIHKGVIFLGCMMFFVTLEAQKIVYVYDASGNRIQRIITRSLSVDTAAYDKLTNDSIQDVSNDDPFAKTADAFEVLVYPNPTQGMIEVEIPGLKTNQKAQMQMYSITGSSVKQIRNLQKRQSIDMTGLSTGIYLLYITVDEKTVMKKIIKQ
ncbi:MAG: T9SS type A sorting domain-containing protein [Prevotellaceae bacterium]|jgi:hypothetical protein|nr:T9SS type A sorting domain-containing protein [Prevotellaceae bacterium]